MSTLCSSRDFYHIPFPYKFLQITALDNLSGWLNWRKYQTTKMWLETNIFIKMSSFWMDTPNFPAMYMQTLLYRATKLKSKHSTAVHGAILHEKRQEWQLSWARCKKWYCINQFWENTSNEWGSNIGTLLLRRYSQFLFFRQIMLHYHMWYEVGINCMGICLWYWRNKIEGATVTLMMRSIDSKVGMVSRRRGGGWMGILKYSYKVCFFFSILLG